MIGRSGRAEKISNTLIEIARLLGSEKPRFNGVSRAGDPQIYWAKIDKARLWGWNPTVNLHDGLEQYVRWFESLKI